MTVPQSARLNVFSRGEVYRKFLHGLPGVLPFVLAYVPHPDPLDAGSIIVVTVICVVLTALFLALFRVVQRDGESDLLLTVLSYPATILVTLMLFPAHAEFAAVVVVVLAFGDTAAHFFGKLLGGPRLPWNRKKTYAGAIAFVAVAAPLATLAYWAEARTPTMSSVPLALAAICGVSAALVGSVAESWPTRLTDNLRVGVSAALAVVVAHFASVGFFLS